MNLSMNTMVMTKISVDVCNNKVYMILSHDTVTAGATKADYNFIHMYVLI